MKNVIGLALSISMLVSAIPQPAVRAADNKCGDKLTWNISSNGTLTISGTGDMYNYHPLDDAPWYNESLNGDIKYIKISEGVESISDYAFQHSTNLKEVILSTTVKRIGSNPFVSSGKLQGINVVPNENSYYCSLKGVLFDKPKTTLIAYPIGNNENSYEIPDTVTTIKSGAFDSSTLTSIKIPRSVKIIEEYAFYGANNFTDVYYGGTAEEWNKINFDKASNFGISSNNTKLTMHYSDLTETIAVESIGFNTDNLVITKGNSAVLSVTFIPSDATNKNVTWSSSNNAVATVADGTVTAVGEGSAVITATSEDGSKTAECTVKVNEPERHENKCGNNLYWTLKEGGKSYCSERRYVLSISGFGDMWDFDNENPAPWKKYINTVLNDHGSYIERVYTDVYISGGVTSIGENAFEYLGYISLPSSLHKIGKSNIIDGGFAYYQGTEEEYNENVTVGQNVNFDCINFQKQLTETVSGSYGDDITWTLTPDGTMTISGKGEIPWWKLSGLYINDDYDHPYENAVKKIIVNDGITGINNFADFGYLTEVVLPESITCIGSSCFMGDMNLKKIVLPGTITKIDNGVFFLSGLKEIYYDSTASNWNIIEKYAPLENDITVYYAPEKESGLYEYEVENGKAKITDVDTSISGDIIIPSALGGYPVESIGDEAFRDCSKLTSVVIPDSVKNIGYSTFAYCDSLEQITIPGELEFEYGNEVFGTNQFYKCTELKAIKISGDSTKYSVDNGILFSKDGKTLIAYLPGKNNVSYTVPSDVEKIGISAFESCNKLRAVIIPEGIVSIDSMSLWCDNLEVLTIPKTAVEFGWHQYWGNDDKPIDVYYAGTKEEYDSRIGRKFPDRVTLHYNYTDKEVTIAADAQNGQVNGGGIFRFGSVVTLTTTADSGYKFIGWYVGDVVVSNDSEYSFIACEDVNVTAKFDKISTNSGGSLSGGTVVKYIVKFVTNGGNEIEAIRASRNTIVSRPVDPTRNGYIFDGWYSDKELTNKYDFTTKILSDTTLYAGWVKSDGEKNQLVLTIGSTNASVFGENKSNDVAPIIRNDRTMLPARFVAENLGAVVEWNEKNREVLITSKKSDGSEVIIKIFIDSDTAYVNDNKITLDSPAFIENDRTYTPIRFIAESLGAKVDWNETEKKVIITKN